MDGRTPEVTRQQQDFTPKPPAPINQEPQNSLGWRVAHKLGLASLATSLGFLGATATGHGETVVNPVRSAVSNTADAAGQLMSTRDAISVKNDDAAEDLNRLGVKFGDIRPTSKHGENGVIYQRGALGSIDISGSVGVGSVGTQPLRVRSGEPTMEGKEVSLEDLQEQGVNLKDVWVTEVYGGPDTSPTKEDGDPANWVRFTAKDKDGNAVNFFAAQKFFTPSETGEKMLETTSPDGTKVQAPFTPIK